jgi:molybdopterin-guanine dinucleotide biosynthesis protein A
MTVAAREVSAVVLAGGRSRRFGQDKATTHWRARALLDHVLEALPRERTETVLVLRDDQKPPATRVDRVVRDDPSLGDGPLRGLISGLSAVRTEWAWVVACDLPAVRTELLRALLQEASLGSHAVVPEWQGRLQPLTALYHRSIVQPLRDAAAAGERSLIGALGRTRLQLLGEDWCRAVDPSGRSFTNVNRPEDLARLEDQSNPGT